MTTKEILIAARKRIEKPENWTKEAYARTRGRRKVDYDHPKAVCWCALSAIQCEAPSGTAVQECCEAVLRQADGWGMTEIIAFNDYPEIEHSDVMFAFDKAIASLS